MDRADSRMAQLLNLLRTFFDADEAYDEENLRELLALTDNQICADAFCHSRDCSNYLVEEKKGSDTKQAVEQLDETCKSLKRLGKEIKECVLISSRIEKRLYKNVGGYLHLKMGNHAVRVYGGIRIKIIKPEGLRNPPLTHYQTR